MSAIVIVKALVSCLLIEQAECMQRAPVSAYARPSSTDSTHRLRDAADSTSQPRPADFVLSGSPTTQSSSNCNASGFECNGFCDVMLRLLAIPSVVCVVICVFFLGVMSLWLPCVMGWTAIVQPFLIIPEVFRSWKYRKSRIGGVGSDVTYSDKWVPNSDKTTSWVSGEWVPAHDVKGTIKTSNAEDLLEQYCMIEHHFIFDQNTRDTIRPVPADLTHLHLNGLDFCGSKDAGFGLVSRCRLATELFSTEATKWICHSPNHNHWVARALTDYVNVMGFVMMFYWVYSIYNTHHVYRYVKLDYMSNQTLTDLVKKLNECSESGQKLAIGLNEKVDGATKETLVKVDGATMPETLVKVDGREVDGASHANAWKSETASEEMSKTQFCKLKLEKKMSFPSGTVSVSSLLKFQTEIEGSGCTKFPKKIVNAGRVFWNEHFWRYIVCSLWIVAICYIFRRYACTGNRGMWPWQKGNRAQNGHYHHTEFHLFSDLKEIYGDRVDNSSPSA